jgi:hypothetical protein
MLQEYGPLLWAQVRISIVYKEVCYRSVTKEHMSSPPVFSGIRVTGSLVLYVCFVDRCLSLCTFLLAIVLSVLLRFTDSDYHFGIYKLFLASDFYIK